MKKKWWELNDIERKEIWERSCRIFYAFDGFGSREKTDKAETIIKETIFQMASKRFDDLLEKIKGDSAEDDLCDFFDHVCFPAFAVGYVFGQMFDLAHSDLQNDVEALKKKLQDRRAFAYLPREKKAA